MPERFTNWSGSIGFAPRERFRAESAEDVAALVRRARDRGGRLRPVGSGHSSTPLVVTDDVLVSLDEFSGVESTNRDAGLASVRPGTGLADLGAELAEHGLGMENLGDVDYQSIAGAIGTGTHGTGVDLGNLSSALAGGTIVTGTGEPLTFGVDPDGYGDPSGTEDLLRAVQVGLGSLGILTRLTLRVRPAYDLHRTNWMTHIDWVLDNFDELVERNRHVDFYWYPRSDLAQVRMLNEPGSEPDITPPGHLKKEETGPSYEVIPNPQELRFEEMEYMLPLDTGLAAFREARQRIKERHRRDVGWRVLVRTIAADRAMLSPASERPTMTIALLHNASLPYEDYFFDMERLFRAYEGRPHWGKKHSLGEAKLAELYPEWESFQSIRRRFDPDGVFLNDYLRELFAAT